jgi:hypothetical protein
MSASDATAAAAGQESVVAAVPPMLCGEHRFSPAVCGYFERHAVDLNLAHELGVRSDRDAILYPYTTPRGESYRRRRDPDTGITAQPKGEPLILWWPRSRPDPGTDVLLCEGEPDALAALSALDGYPVAVAALPGTSIPAERVTAELAGAGCVYLALDGDEPGRKAADRLARALQQYTELRVVRLGEGEDLASRLFSEQDRSGWLRATLEGASEAPKLALKSEPEGYGRKKAADRLRDLRARGIDPDMPLGGLLDSLVALIRRFVVVSEAQAAVIAVWIAHAHAILAADSTPYLGVSSAEKRSGKSRLLEVLAQAVPHPMEAANISPPALFRALAGDVPSTLLFDEIDGTFGPKARENDDLRSLVNAGYRRGAKAYRCVGEGAKQKVEPFEVFGPKALAGIGKLPETIADRSIPIRLHRRSRSEPVERGRYRTIAAAAEPLRELLALWAGGAVGELRKAEPGLPDELDDRAQDGAEPLLAIADMAGGDWPQRARAALIELHSQKPDEGDSWGVQLLAGIRAAFGDEERLSTEDVLDRLKVDPEAPWAGWNEGKGLSPRGLANLLRPYEIKSKQTRFGEETRKGYLREQFEDAWQRYLPPSVPSMRNKRNNGLNKPETPDSQAKQEGSVFRIENPEKPLEQANVSDVSDRSAKEGAEAPWDEQLDLVALALSADAAAGVAARYGLEAFEG